MRFIDTPLAGAFVIESDPVRDERGWFERVWCRRELAARGLDVQLAQNSLSFTRERGTLRGMHYQIPPHAETKIVACVAGAIHDVVIDLRPDSLTFGAHFSLRLEARVSTMLYVPRGFAHGFQTLEDDTSVLYQISDFYAPEAARGIRWNDPTFGIKWPIHPPALSARDRSWPDFALSQ